MIESKSFFLSAGLVIVLAINSITGFSQNSTQLTAYEKEGILLMREEEKLAHDVYSFFVEKYNIPIFRNIKQSEVMHQKSMIWLMEKYDIKDPSFEEQGKFNNKELQKLYDRLTVQGNTLIEALKIGAYIEELDIFDLKKLMKKTDNEDILRVYSRLLWGSENHFRAFTRNLSNRGVEYEPEFLTKEEMETMLNKYNQRNRNWNRE
ncbi:MAG: DUF2202 domain-containing protein [Bacteroidales bacterium]|jgi:hypothetical protein|nr:DUF2202 domain-containing protein [Bacteroidales bacterium]MCO6467635.1 DUF2202 domain-containing protein [Bacteroidales bacterium]MCZ2282769.1 DUF2202 domain-containing protein [Bacteroidales bacterium]MDI9593098.1 DUF2202 domain-containing protein [Bacteroidota bacterium]HOF81266.1 DUF2202 domain-containing protein [Bacteroidales bacterium]